MPEQSLGEDPERKAGAPSVKIGSNQAREEGSREPEELEER